VKVVASTVMVRPMSSSVVDARAIAASWRGRDAAVARRRVGDAPAAGRIEAVVRGGARRDHGRALGTA
jgi:hypothetical protein